MLQDDEARHISSNCIQCSALFAKVQWTCGQYIDLRRIALKRAISKLDDEGGQHGSMAGKLLFVTCGRSQFFSHVANI